MKKLNLLILVSLLCAGLVQAQDADDPELQALIKTYKAMKAQQNATPKAEDPKVRYEKALIQAARAGNASQVRGLLEAGTNPNVTDEHGNTPLIYAAKENLAAVDMLLFAGADVNARGENGITALINSFSVTGPEANTIRTRLLKAKPDVNAVMNLNLPRCKSEDRIWGSYLWGEDTIFGKDPKCKPNPATALSLAAASDDVNAVETLLKNGADVNVAFPIRSAATSSKPNSAKIVELLLKAGADPRQVDIKEVSGKDKKGLIKKAMNKSDKAQQKLDNKLYEAVQKGNVEQVKKLLEKGANPNSYYFGAYDAREYYETPLLALMHYTEDGEQALEIMKVLINAGADVNARNRSYSTALHYNYTDIEKFKLLIQSGADVNARNMYGRTPLFGAGEKNIKLYIKAGADVNARDYEGLSALFHVTVNPKRHSTAELLQVYGAKLTPYEKRLLPTMQKRQQLNLTTPRESAQQAQNDSGNGLGRTLLQGAANAAQDTVNFAIQNAGKF